MRRTYIGHVSQVGVLSQGVNTQLVSEARFRLFLVPTHFFLLPFKRLIIPEVSKLLSHPI